MRKKERGGGGNAGRKTGGNVEKPRPDKIANMNTNEANGVTRRDGSVDAGEPLTVDGKRSGDAVRAGDETLREKMAFQGGLQNGVERRWREGRS